MAPATAARDPHSSSSSSSSPPSSSTPSPSHSSAMSSGVLVQADEGGSSSAAEDVSFDQPKQRVRGKSNSNSSLNSLGADPRGDTGAAAMATLQSVPYVSSTSNAEAEAVSGQDASRLGLDGGGSDGRRISTGEKSQQQHQQSKQLPKTSKRRKARTLFRRWKSLSQRHTWVNPLVVCLMVVSAYLLNPKPSNPLHKALFLSYPVETDMWESTSEQVLLGHDHKFIDTSSEAGQPVATVIPTAKTMYGKGPADFAFVAFYTIFLSFTREFIMQRILRPIATSASLRPHLRSRAKQARFMEQAYTAIYFGILGPFGLYVMRYQSPLWYFNTRAMYDGFPHRLHLAAFKAYYLIEASYWLQQMGVLLLMLEKPRKDFKELVAHHIITLALIGLSYRFHFTYMGLAVYITHDVSDFFLATSKILNYTSSPLLAPYFASFIAIWTYLRHYINLRILASVLTEFSTVGPFTLDWQAQQYKCRLSQTIVFALLASLQAINLFWLVLILRIALRFVKSLTGIGGGGRKGSAEVRDIRSDDEDDEDDEIENEGMGEASKGKDEKDAKGEMVDGSKGSSGAVRGNAESDDRKQTNGRENAPQVLLNGSPLAAGGMSTGSTGAGSIATADDGVEMPRQRRSSPRRKVR